MNIKICHVSSVHSRYDVRIFQKECISLYKHGYDVNLLINDTNSDESKDGIKIFSTGKRNINKWKRIFFDVPQIRRKLMQIDAKVYHLHDPELLTLVRYLKRKGKIVIFDSHEDYLSTIGIKEWIPKIFRKILSQYYTYYEKRTIKQCNGAVVCYHWTMERFSKICREVAMVLNFPIVQYDDKMVKNDFSSRSLCFAGGVSRQWCHHEIVQALGMIDDVTYKIAGPVSDEYLDELKKIKGWDQVQFYGKLNHNEVYSKIYTNCSIGVVLLDYIPQCKYTIGNLSNTKFFECMYAGLPIICTDFVLWKEIVENEKCGICVNPHNIEQIVSAITYLLDNPDIARQMGENGRNAVMKKYNWDTEEQKLLAFYDKVLNQNA